MYEYIPHRAVEENRDHTHQLSQCLMVVIDPLRAEELVKVLRLISLQGKFQRSTWICAGRIKSKLFCRYALVQSPLLRAALPDSLCFLTAPPRCSSPQTALSPYRMVRIIIFLTSLRTRSWPKVCVGVLLLLNYQIEKESTKGFPLAGYAVQDGVDSLLGADRPHFAASSGCAK